MAKKKTTYSWVILASTAIGIIVGLSDAVIRSIFAGSMLSDSAIHTYIQSILSVFLSTASSVIFVIYFYKLYNVKPDLIKWTNITLGYLIILFVFGFLLGISYWGSLIWLAAVLIAGMIVGVIFLRISFVNHLRKAEKEKLMDFS